MDNEACFLFLEEMDTLTFLQLDEEAPLPGQLRLYDARLYAAVVLAVSVHHGDVGLRITETSRFGCGRQAVKVLDTAAHYSASHLAVAAIEYLGAAAGTVLHIKQLSDFCSRVRKALRLASGVPGGRVNDLVAVSQVKAAIVKIDDKTLSILMCAFDIKPQNERTVAELVHILETRASNWALEEEKRTGKKPLSANAALEGTPGRGAQGAGARIQGACRWCQVIGHKEVDLSLIHI